MENKNITVDKLVEICESTLISEYVPSTIQKFCCDTRILKKGDMFI